MTSHSRTLGEWPHHCGHPSLRPLLYSSSVYSCHLFLISSASVRSLPFLSFIMPILTRNVPLVSPVFLKRSLVLPVLLFSSISLHWLLKKASYLFLLFFGTLHSDAYIFPFLLGFLLHLTFLESKPIACVVPFLVLEPLSTLHELLYFLTKPRLNPLHLNRAFRLH